jgi:hypothetical protein
MRLIPRGKAAWQKSAVLMTACPLLLLVGAQVALMQLRVSRGAAAYMQDSLLLLIVEAVFAIALAMVSLTMLLVRPRLGLAGLLLLLLAIVLFLIGPFPMWGTN